MTVKGRAAAELSSAGGAELALAEALFGGGLSGMRPEHLAALLSCLVWQESGLFERRRRKRRQRRLRRARPRRRRPAAPAGP